MGAQVSRALSEHDVCFGAVFEEQAQYSGGPGVALGRQLRGGDVPGAAVARRHGLLGAGTQGMADLGQGYMAPAGLG
jgi:hypothetical protein